MDRRDETQRIQLLDVERRLERVERLLRAAADEARGARIDLGHKSGPGERWARMMFAVLDEVDRLGGEVSRRRFLQIGEKHGYNHRGMAGFYNQLVEPMPEYKTRLTARGRERLRTLRESLRRGSAVVSVMPPHHLHDRPEPHGLDTITRDVLTPPFM